MKAISRASYENIVGIYDGFDAIKWSVGSITVEGVTYSNCQMRYSISTQVWTIYDFNDKNITALVRYDDGTTIEQIVGTSTGLVGKLDSGYTDWGEDIYYEMIDHWRSFTEMDSHSKDISGLAVMSENSAGTLCQYQTDAMDTNVWEDLGTTSNDYVSLFPNSKTDDFNEVRLRLNGYSQGEPIIFEGIELLAIQDKGLDQN